MDEEKRKIRRREFFGAGGAMLLGGAANAAFPAANDAPNAGNAPAKWDETCDVVVVGTGFAGLAAAFEARGRGADVLVIDKMPVYGGNSIVNGGDFAAPGNIFQKESGIEDSPDLMLKDMLAAGLNLNHPDLARMVCLHAGEALEWAQTVIGAKFTRLNFHGGHSVKRSVQTVNQSGSELVNKLLTKVLESGVKVETRVKMTRLFAGKDGRIAGMEVRRGYKWPIDASGTPATIKANRAVVLASGGFSRDAALRQAHDPRLAPELESTNHPGATGEALLEACRAGAMSVHMDWIQLGPWTSPDEPGFGYTPQVCERIVGYGLMVDPATGKRFFKETGNRKERADAIIALGHPAVIFGDTYAVESQVEPRGLQKAMETGAVRRFDTLEELAGAYGIPAKPFLEEIARWNGFVDKKKDPDFDCMIFPDARPTAKAPYYAMRLWPRVHHTMGGLLINTQAQVIGLDMKPIPGLYAAGEVAGGIHGAVRLGSVAMADCVIFGRIAGRNAGGNAAISSQ
ncbi:MAG: flavocytochrome c [Acidobacteriota bacterium]|jgi:flavocytochrome c|nr:flavocytochrome c [Acidobacteriota bacterium]